MKEQIPQPAPLSRTLQGKTCEANTASVTNVLQAYKKDISQRQEVDEDELLQGKFETAQRDELEDDELLQGKFETVQRDEMEDEEILQGKFETTQREEAPNNTGLPDNLKAGVEQLSGLDMSDVKVHYNSSKPASVQAYAYTQGTDIHVAPGQEKYLGHEAWHLAQQKQGRVQPTTTVGGMPVNDNAGLENEADVMGGKAIQMKPEVNKSSAAANSVAQKKSNVTQGFGFVDYRHSRNNLITPPTNVIQCGEKEDAINKQKLKEEYSKKRYYHGTSSDHQVNIRKEGMSVSQKGLGATNTLPTNSVSEKFFDAAKNHNFMTSEKTEAASYAKTQKNGDPRLIRIVAPEAKLESDSDSFSKNAFRTSDDIPKERIRQKGIHNFRDLPMAVKQDLIQSAGVTVDSDLSLDIELSNSDDDSEIINKAKGMQVK